MPEARSTDLVRLQRVMADAGVAARRACEELIEAGRVTVNGRRVDRLPAFVDPARDRIVVDGRALTRPERRLYVMLNKPGRTLTSVTDASGRRTVGQLVKHPSGSRLYPVGRLDFETTGLVLLTNDGALANRLTHPRYEVPKVYHATVRGVLDAAALAALRTGLAKAERRASRREAAERPGAVPAVARRAGAGSASVEVDIEAREQDRTVLRLTMTRAPSVALWRLLKDAGCSVRRLERVALGPLELSGLPSGAWRELERDELRALRMAARGPRAGRGARRADDAGAAGPAGPAGPAGAARARRVGVGERGGRGGRARRADAGSSGGSGEVLA